MRKASLLQEPRPHTDAASLRDRVHGDAALTAGFFKDFFQFNPNKHPRGANGEFVQVGGTVTGPVTKWNLPKQYIGGQLHAPYGYQPGMSGKVLSIHKNPDNPNDPLVLVDFTAELPKSGKRVTAYMLLSQVSQTAPPKARIKP